MKKIKFRKIFKFVFIAFIVTVFLYLSASFSSFIGNGERVAANTELIYYIDVFYDGKDASAVTSSGTVSADVYSDYVFVEYVIPQNLQFVGFVQPIEGTDIGATLQEDDSVACHGYVVGGVSGLSYNSATREVSYKIKNLQAGCKLTVGVITKTPSLGNLDRLDFYGSAYVKENDFSIYSNTAHTLMGQDTVLLYSLEYAYEGDVPENAPELPTGGSYTYGSTVSLVSKPKVDGYTFNGWRISGLTVNGDGTFVMPDNDVVAVGSFTKNTDYTVTYKLTDDVLPIGYELPEVQTYSQGVYFDVDILKAGDVVSGYVFSGWDYSKLPNCIGNEEDGVICLMPSSNVELTGHFEGLKYTVSYEFVGDDIPENASELLPASSEYTPGDIVTVAGDPVASGYSFLGWYKSETFEMPEEDVVIYGEWMAQNGSFKPVVTQEISDNKAYFSEGDVINFVTTVSNNSEVDIYDVFLQNKSEESVFISGEGYSLMNEKFVTITSIPAGGSISVTASLTVGDDYYKKDVHEVELIGATSSNGYFLDTTINYFASVEYLISNINLAIEVINAEGKNLSGAEFKLYTDPTFTEEAIAVGNYFESLLPDTNYYLKQTRAVAGHVMSSAVTIIVDETGNITVDNGNVEKKENIMTLSILNDEIDMLPQTGGIGNVPFIATGVCIIFASSVLYIVYLRRKENEYDENEIPV